jgi:hypothetical protein
VPFFTSERKSCAKKRKSPRACASPSEAFSEAFYPGEWISNHAPNVAFGFRDGASFRLPRFFLDRAFIRTVRGSHFIPAARSAGLREKESSGLMRRF